MLLTYLRGTLAAVFGIFLLPVGQVIGWLAWLTASYMLVIINGFAKLTFSAINVGTINPALLWVYFAVLAAILWLIPNRKTVGAFFGRTASTWTRCRKNGRCRRCW